MRPLRRTQSYQEQKLIRLAAGICGHVCVDRNKPMMEMIEEAQAGEKRAREAIKGDITGLSGTLDEVMSTWAETAKNFMVLSLALMSFIDCGPETIRQQLMEYRRQTKQGTPERWLVPYSGEA